MYNYAEIRDQVKREKGCCLVKREWFICPGIGDLNNPSDSFNLSFDNHSCALSAFKRRIEKEIDQ